MDYCNCKKCNKIFNHFSGPILCKECDKEVFYLIKNYIENNKFANASIISKELNIPIKIVNDYIRDDRIVEIRKDINLCLLCKTPISDDLKYCNSCYNKIKLINELSNVSRKNEDVIPKMHFLNGSSEKRR